MLNMLIKAVFTIITKLFSLILQPVLNVILSLFPDLSEIIEIILNFFTNYVFPYVAFLVDILENLVFLPHWLLIFLFDYYILKYTMYLTMQGVRFGIKIYNKLKP